MDRLGELPPALRDRLVSQYGLAYFVETGTAAGRTTHDAAACFDRVWTIELDPELHEAAQRKLLHHANVVCLLGDSPQWLRFVLPLLDRPTLFWLDAHWVGKGKPPAVECPLVFELSEINGLDGRHVVTIDDARLFLQPPPPPHRAAAWPTLRTLERIVREWPGGGSLAVHGDTIVITPG